MQKVCKSSKMIVQGNRAVCPVCQAVTRVVILPDTVVLNFPLYCHRCRRTTIVDYNRIRLSDNA